MRAVDGGGVHQRGDAVPEWGPSRAERARPVRGGVAPAGHGIHGVQARRGRAGGRPLRLGIGPGVGVGGRQAWVRDPGAALPLGHPHAPGPRGALPQSLHALPHPVRPFPAGAP